MSTTNLNIPLDNKQAFEQMAAQVANIDHMFKELGQNHGLIDNANFMNGLTQAISSFTAELKEINENPSHDLGDKAVKGIDVLVAPLYETMNQLGILPGETASNLAEQIKSDYNAPGGPDLFNVMEENGENAVKHLLVAASHM